MEKSDLIKKIEGFQIGNELLYDDLKTIKSINVLQLTEGRIFKRLVCALFC